MDSDSDTSAEAAQIQLELLRAMTPTELSAMALRLSDEVARASKRAIQGHILNGMTRKSSKCSWSFTTAKS